LKFFKNLLIQVVKQLAGGLGVVACGPTFPALACGIPGSEACPTHPVWRDSAFTKVCPKKCFIYSSGDYFLVLF
jgi:hypothetical protein